MEQNNSSYLSLYMNLESIMMDLEDNLENLRSELDLLYYSKLSDEDKYYLNQRKIERNEEGP